MNSQIPKMPSFLTPLDIEAARIEINDLIKKSISYIPLSGDDIQIVINSILYVLSLKIDKFNYIISQNYLEYSSGEFLDELVKLAGITRQKASQNLATASITAKSPTILPSGAVFLSSDGARAYLAHEARLPIGVSKVTLLSDEVGKWDTNILQIPNALITKITVDAPFCAIHRLESDLELRQRFCKSLHRFTTAGSKKAYEFFSSTPLVKKTLALNQSAGNVKIIYYADDEVNAKEEILKELKDNTPLTDTVEVVPVSRQTINITINLKLKKINNFDLICRAIKTNIHQNFTNLAIGQNLATNKLIASAFIDDDILDAEIISNLPTSIGEDEMLILGTLDITQSMSDV